MGGSTEHGRESPQEATGHLRPGSGTRMGATASRKEMDTSEVSTPRSSSTFDATGGVCIGTLASTSIGNDGGCDEQEYEPAGGILATLDGLLAEDRAPKRRP